MNAVRSTNGANKIHNPHISGPRLDTMIFPITLRAFSSMKEQSSAYLQTTKLSLTGFDMEWIHVEILFFSFT